MISEFDDAVLIYFFDKFIMFFPSWYSAFCFDLLNAIDINILINFTW